MPAEIRPARATDIDALVALEESAFESERHSRRTFRNLSSAATAALLVATEGGKLLGYCLVLFRSNSAGARLYSIATAHEGTGLGRRLLNAAEAAARARGCLTIHLEVREDNLRAIQIYEKSGYRQTGTRPGYYSDGQSARTYRKVLVDRAPAGTASRESHQNAQQGQ